MTCSAQVATMIIRLVQSVSQSVVDQSFIQSIKN